MSRPDRARRLAWGLGGAALAVTLALAARGVWSLAPLPLGAAMGAAFFLATPTSRAPSPPRELPVRTRARELATWAALVAILALGFRATATAAPFSVPLAADLLAGAAAALLAWDALGAREGHDRQRVALRIALFWAVLLVERQLPFARGITSPDIGTHLTTMILPILDSGHIPPGASYSSFPMHHLLVIAVHMLGGTQDVRHAYAIAGTAIALTLPLLLVRRGDDEASRRGLWSGILLGAAAYAFNVLSHPSALSYAIPAAIVLIDQATRPSAGRLPIAVLMPIGLMALFTHPYSTAILLVILTGIALVRATTMERSRRTWRTVAIALTVGAALFLTILQISGILSLVTEYLSRVTGAAGASPTGATAGSFYDQLPAATLAINVGPVVLFLAVAAFGWLLAVDRLRAHALTLALSIVLAIPIVLGVLGIPLTFPDRWYAYLELVVLVPLAGLAMVPIAQRSRSGAILACALLVAIAPATIVAGAEGSPLANGALHMRTFFTDQEGVAEAWALDGTSAPPNVRVYAAPGFLHERSGALAVEAYDPPEGPQLQIVHTPRPALVLTSRLATQYGVATSFLPGDRIGGTILTPLRYDDLDASQLVDRLYVNDGASVYHVRTAPP